MILQTSVQFKFRISGQSHTQLCGFSCCVQRQVGSTTTALPWHVQLHWGHLLQQQMSGVRHFTGSNIPLHGSYAGVVVDVDAPHFPPVDGTIISMQITAAKSTRVCIISTCYRSLKSYRTLIIVRSIHLLYGLLIFIFCYKMCFVKYKSLAQNINHHNYCFECIQYGKHSFTNVCVKFL